MDHAEWSKLGHAAVLNGLRWIMLLVLNGQAGSCHGVEWSKLGHVVMVNG